MDCVVGFDLNIFYKRKYRLVRMTIMGATLVENKPKEDLERLSVRAESIH